MYEQDYIKRLINQVSIFIRKLLKIDIDVNQEEFITCFNEMIRKFYKTNLTELDSLEKNKNFENLLFNDHFKNQKALVFYKAAFIYFNIDKETSKRCFSIAEKIYHSKTKVIHLFEDAKINSEIEKYRALLNFL